MDRRAMLLGLGAGAAVLMTATASAAALPPLGGPDPTPTEKDLRKYKTCRYCEMNRTMWRHSRHLVHYADGRVDPTCSIRCVAVALVVNAELGIKGIYAADFGKPEALSPLVDVSTVTYLVGSTLPGTMAPTSKMAFADRAAAEAAKGKHGGELMNFEGAFDAAFKDLGRFATSNWRRSQGRKR